MPSILFLGATGYIGSAVFNAFINAHPAFQYTALVRTPSHSSHIRAVNTVVGTFEDRSLLAKLAREADIIVNVARADDLGMAEALIEGLKRRKEEDGKVSTFIHTCGGDSFEGRESWDDVDEECVRVLLDKPVVQTLLCADNEGVLHAHFIAPTVVYGLNPYDKPSPFYLQITRELLSLPKPLGSTLPFSALTSNSLKETPNRVMGMVHVDDLASLYLLVLNKIRVRPGSTPTRENASSRVYIASAYERSCSDLYHDVHKALVRRGLLTICHEPSQTEDEGHTSEPHFRSRRAKSELGWEPAKPAWHHDMEWDIKRALEVLKVIPAGASSTTTT